MIRRARQWLADKLIDWPIVPFPLASKLAGWIEPEPEIDVSNVLDGLAVFAALALLLRDAEGTSKLLGSVSADVKKAVSFLYEPPDV